MIGRQKLVFWIWVLFVAGMGIYPPWAIDQLAGGEGGGGGNTPFTEGYSFIFTAHGGRIDLLRLLVGWAVVTVLAAGCYFAWPLKPAPPAAAKP